MKGAKVTAFLFLFMILIFSVAGSEWNRYGGDYPKGSIFDEVGLYSDASNITKDTAIRTGDNQVLVTDLDNDEVSEVIVVEENILYIYNIDDNDELDLKSSYTVSGANFTITPAVFPDHDADGLKEIITVFNEYLYVFEYNGSKPFNKISLKDKHYLGRTPAGNMFCDTGHDYSSNMYCFIPTDDGYIQKVLVTTPFPIFPWDMQDEPESDDEYNGITPALGDTVTNKGIDFEFAIRGNDAGNIDELRIGINSTTGSPYLNGFIYDIKICTLSGGNYTSGGLASDCSDTPTVLYDNFNLSQGFGNTSGVKSIMFETEYFLEEFYNYSIIFEYVSGLDSDGANDYYNINVDTAPTDYIIRKIFDIVENLLSSVPQATLFGSTVAEHTETDICPSSSSCLDSAPDIQAPIMIQDANNGKYKLALIHDNNGNGDDGLALIDMDSNDFDTQFNSVGYIDELEGSDNRIAGIVAGDIDGGSDDIIVSMSIYELFNYNGVYIGAIDLTGSLVSGDWYLVGGDCGAGTGLKPASAPCQLRIETTPGVFLEHTYCVIRGCDNGAGSDTWIRCQDLETGLDLVAEQYTGGSTWDTEIMGQHSKPIYSARMMFSDDNSPQLITQRGIMIINYSSTEIDYYITVAPMTNGGNPNNRHTITIADANDDGSLDILGLRSIGISGAELYFHSSTNSNQPPSIYPQLAYGGYGSEYGVNNPKVCIDTDIEFFAKENPTYPTGNYENDLAIDQERIRTNCGYDDAGNPTLDYTDYLQTGTYDDDNPVFECHYDKTGVYRVRLFLQDSANPDNLNVGNTQDIIVTVLNGTQNVDCNILTDYQDTGDVTIGLNGTSIGSPCVKDSECITNNCEYGVCTYKSGGQRCDNDFECLSQSCENGRCRKAGVWESIDHSKDVQFGDDTNDNNFISLLLSIGIMLIFILGSGGNIVGIIAGLVVGFGLMAFFTFVGWLSAWIFFAILIALILLSTLVVLIFKGGE